MALFDPSGGGRRRQPIGKTFLVRVAKGQTVVSAWPKKRGSQFKKKNQPRSEFFKTVQQAFKHLPPWEHDVYLRMSQTGPFLPRDFWTMNAYGRFIALEQEGGATMYPERAVFDVSQSLDILGQTPGGVLIRQGKYWQNLPPGPDGFVLTSKGETDFPAWEAPTGGGGGNPYLEPPTLDLFPTEDRMSVLDAIDSQQTGVAFKADGLSTKTAYAMQPWDAGSTYVEGAFEDIGASGRNVQVSICLADSTSKKLYRCGLRFEGVGNNAEYDASIYSNYETGSFSSIATRGAFQTRGNVFFRITKSGNDLTFAFGSDPDALIEFDTVTDSGFASGVDLCGLHIFSQGINALPGTGRIIHWKQA